MKISRIYAGSHQELRRRRRRKRKGKKLTYYMLSLKLCSLCFHLMQFNNIKKLSIRFLALFALNDMSHYLTGRTLTSTQSVLANFCQDAISTSTAQPIHGHYGICCKLEFLIQRLHCRAAYFFLHPNKTYVQCIDTQSMHFNSPIINSMELNHEWSWLLVLLTFCHKMKFHVHEDHINKQKQRHGNILL